MWPSSVLRTFPAIEAAYQSDVVPPVVPTDNFLVAVLTVVSVSTIHLYSFLARNALLRYLLMSLLCLVSSGRTSCIRIAAVCTSTS